MVENIQSTCSWIIIQWPQLSKSETMLFSNKVLLLAHTTCLQIIIILLLIIIYLSLTLFTVLWLCVEIRVVSEIFQNLKTVYLDIYKVRRSDTLTLPVSSRSWHGTKCIRKGEIMTVQTRIQTHALRISSQVLY